MDLTGHDAQPIFVRLQRRLHSAWLIAVCALVPAVAGAGTIVTGLGPGATPTVGVYDSATSSPVATFFAYAASFTGGVRVAVGDVNGDGVPDIVTGAGPGAASHVKVFDGKTGAEIRSFFAFGPSFAGGVYVAAGDIDGDGKADIIVGADAGGAPHVKVFDGATGAEVRSFFAYDVAFAGGVRVAAGDVNGDGVADIVTGAGPGAVPHVKAFDGLTGNEIRSFFAFGPAFGGGVYVAVGDVNDDGKDDIIVGADAGGAPHVKVFDGATVAEIRSFFAYDPAFAGGVRVAAGDVNGDNKADIVTGAGPGGLPQIKTFDGATGALVGSFLATTPSFQGGVYVAATALESLEPFEPIASTLSAAVASNFRQGIKLLENALRNLDSGDIRAACNMVSAFINQVEAQSGKSLTEAVADQLILSAMHDRAALGCP